MPTSSVGSRRRHRAFSLIELLVALAIVAAVAAVTAPALSGAVERARYRTATRTLVSALRDARREAQSHEADIVFTLDIERRRFGVGEPEDVLTLPDRATLSLVSAVSEQRDEHTGGIRFFADGSSTGGEVTIALDGRSETVTVHWLTGRVEVEE